MKILLLNQFFWPDSAATSQFLTDLAKGLAARGHEVYAISAEGGGYAVADLSDPPPVHIHRVRTTRFAHGSLGRVFSYGSFFFSCLTRGLTVARPDLVITLTTPPLLPLIGNALKFARGTRHFIWEMDVYPDVAVDLNYFKSGGLLDRITGLLADFSRRHADGILALGPCMKDRLMARGVPEKKIHIAENWADGTLIQPVPRPENNERLTLLYSGNLGLAHDTDTIFAAMKELKVDERFRFVFAGGGPLRKGLELACKDDAIIAAEFRPYSQKANLGESLGIGDIGLVTQRTACVGSVVPSKIYGLLAAGRPILFIGPRTSTAAQLIEQHGCGWQIDCGASGALVELLRSLAEHRSDVVAAGERAREAFLESYDLPLGVDRICKLVGAFSNDEHGGVRLTLSTNESP
ncbi:MAG: glycosyltransferase family 4 protein [Acidobacteriota bacterium]|nr:glycosyltransferase family 4 protein [Acidobacteriota bacterium]